MFEKLLEPSVLSLVDSQDDFTPSEDKLLDLSS